MEENIKTVEVSEEAEAIAGAYLNSNSQKAQNLLNNADKLEELLIKAEELVKKINLPKIKIQKFNLELDPAEILAYVALMIALIRMYIKKEYTKIPVASIIMVIATIIYLVNPFDVIPDVLPVVGHIDDAVLIALCIATIKGDLDDFKKWKEENGQ